jgi:hypothetical protein
MISSYCDQILRRLVGPLWVTSGRHLAARFRSGIWSGADVRLAVQRRLEADEAEESFGSGCPLHRETHYLGSPLFVSASSVDHPAASGRHF